MPEIELTAGTVEYEDTGGDGPVVVLLHGVMMDESVWRDVTRDLRDGHRVIVPALPLGAHRKPLRGDADVSMLGLARLVAELLDRLDLHDVTLVGNDLGLSQVVAAEHPDRLGRLVITPQEAFDNIPPGLPGKFAGLSGRLPGGIWMAAQSLRVGPLQRSPIAFGWMAKRPIPKEVVRRWVRNALSDRGVRRDLVRYIKTTDYGVLNDTAEKLRSFDRPTLVAWASEDKVMPPEHGRRLAELIPGARHVEIADSYTLVPLDQPAVLSNHIREFVREAGHVHA